MSNPDTAHVAGDGWANAIVHQRLQLRESQETFGKRFGVSHAAISDWERGISEAPYKVTWYILLQLLARKVTNADDISLCTNGCMCMTHTVDGVCGKCGLRKEG